MPSMQHGLSRRGVFERLEQRLVLATYHVSTAGSDSNTGSIDAPWATLQRAADVVDPGDTVLVNAGTYSGFDLRRDGTAIGIDPRCTGKCGAFATRVPSSAKTAQEKSRRSLMFTE